MKSYAIADISERQLEELVRRHSRLIEEGLAYVDHQRRAGGRRLDVLMVDSRKSLVVAELKVTQDDGMLVQGLDYYDFVSSHLESLATHYKAHSIDPARKVRLILIAPAFPQSLINRCKWLDLPISLFTYKCLKLRDDSDPVPVLTKREVTSKPFPLRLPTADDHLAHITDADVRALVSALLGEIDGWNPERVLIDVSGYGFSLRVNNLVFAWIATRRKGLIISTYDADNRYKNYRVRNGDDLAVVRSVMRTAMERRARFPR